MLSEAFSSRNWHLPKREAGQGVYLIFTDLVLPPTQPLSPPTTSKGLQDAWAPHTLCHVPLPKENLTPAFFFFPLSSHITAKIPVIDLD